MINTSVIRPEVAKMAAMDAALVAGACFIPAVSHILSFPLYMLNPMLALLLVGAALGRDWRNTVLLAVLLPAVSSLLTGMPEAGKMVCMMAELATVAGLLHVLRSKWAAVPSVLLVAMVGKAVYYAMKALVLAPAVLVGTGWQVQLGAVVVWGGLYALLCRKAAERK